MPMYEYYCDQCKKVHEIVQKYSDPLATECEVCKGPLIKLISSGSFKLNGGGWFSPGMPKKGTK